MKQIVKRMVAVICMICMIIMMLPIQPVHAASKISLSDKSKALAVGESCKLTVKGAKGTVKWSSSNKKVAKVTAKGQVTAVAVGKATIKATANGKKLSCKVTVTQYRLNQTKLKVKTGKKATLKVLKKAKSVKWSTSNKKIATVSKKGVVKGIKPGKATITAKVGKKNLKCKVTVVQGDNVVMTDDYAEKVDFEDKVVENMKTANDYTYTTKSDGFIQINTVQGLDLSDVKSGKVLILPDEQGNPAGAIKVSSVTKEKDGTTQITGTKPQIDEVFERIDFDTDTEISISEIDFDENVVADVRYDENANAAILSVDDVSLTEADRMSEGNSLRSTGLLDSNVNASIGKYGKINGSLKISKPVVHAKIAFDFASNTGADSLVKMGVKETVSTDLKVEFSSQSDGEETFQKKLGTATVPLSYGFQAECDVYLVLSASGYAQIKCTVTEDPTFTYDNGKMTLPSLKPSYTFEAVAEADGKACAKLATKISWGLTMLNVDVIGADFDIGPGVHGKIELHAPETPHACTQVDVYLYTAITLDTKNGIGKDIKDVNPSFNDTWVLLDNNDKNPARKSWHYEMSAKDSSWAKVTKCTYTGKDSASEALTFTKDDNGLHIELDENGLLTVTGTSENGRPWGHYGWLPVAASTHRKYVLAVKKAKINIQGVKDFSSTLGESYDNLESVDFTGTDFSKGTSFNNAFHNCTNLKEIKWDQSIKQCAPSDIGGMFSFCQSMTYIDLSWLNTSNLTNMEYLFAGCSNLKAVNLRGFDTSKVKSMRYLFWECKSLKEADLTSFSNASVPVNGRVNGYSYMFSETDSLARIRVSRKKWIMDENSNDYRNVILDSNVKALTYE